MNMIDTSIYRRAPSLSSGLDSLTRGLQSIRANRIQDENLAKQNKLSEIQYQNALINQQENQRKLSQAANFRKDFEEMGYVPGISDPREIQDLYTDYYPEQIAQMQLKQAFNTNPLAQAEFEQKQKRLALSDERLSLQKEEANRRKKKDSFMEDYRNKTLDWKQKDYDRGVYEYETTLAEKLRDQDWQESQRDREQLELLGKITPTIQKYKLPGKKLDQVEVRKINEGTSATGNLLALSGELNNKIDKFGLTKIKGENKAAMESAVRAMAVSLNNPMFVNSGVMSEGELDNLRQMVGDPTDFFALSEAEVKARMRSLQQFIKSKYINSLDAYGVDGAKAYQAIRLKTNDFFKKTSKEAEQITPEEESWLR